MESKQNRTMEKCESVMEKEREWKEKTKGTRCCFVAGRTMGGKLEGQEGNFTV